MSVVGSLAGPGGEAGGSVGVSDMMQAAGVIIPTDHTHGKGTALS